MHEETLSSKVIYDGVVIKLTLDEVKLSNGKTSKREVAHMNGAVAVLAITQDRKVPLVKQFRYPYGEAMLEIPAGKLDKGNEDLIDAAKRELSEETGYIANNMIDLGEFRPSCGALDEVVHLYAATDLTEGKMHLDEGEILNVEYYDLSELEEKILANEITDSKTIIATLKYLKLVDSINQ